MTTNLVIDPPQQLSSFDIELLKIICQDYIDAIASGDDTDDFEHYIFETALECVFGANVWHFINEF